MDSYSDPNANAGERGNPYYGSTPTQLQQQHADVDEGMNLGHNIAPSMHAGLAAGLQNNPDLRAHGHFHQHYPQHPGTDPILNRQHMHGDDEPMDQMASQYNTSDASMPPRKRSKVSRACDECRKKKIRCDATGEHPNEECSSCRRTGAECLFSRIPQKRGPSKGYIKELSDRVRKLEASPLQNGMLDSSLSALTELSSVSNPEGAQRKRTFGDPEHGNEFVYQQAVPSRTLAPWSPPQAHFSQGPHNPFSQPTPPPLHRLVSGEHQNSRGSDIAPNGLHNQHQLPQDWSVPPEPAHLQTPSAEAAHLSTGELILSNETAINRYYEDMHSHLPFLAEKTQTQLERVASCPAPLADAFYGALNTVSRSLTAADLSKSEAGQAQKAAQLVFNYSSAAGLNHRDWSTRLVYLQTLILTAIEAQCQELNGGSTHQTAGNEASAWISSAVGLAYQMRLYMHRPHQQLSAINDDDSEENLARRLWVSLCVIEKWHTHSTGVPSMIPEHTFVFYREDKEILGQPLYWLARLALVIGGMGNENFATTGALPDLNSGPRRDLVYWRMDIPDTFAESTPILYLCYWHLVLLDALDIESTKMKHLREATDEMTKIIINAKGVVSPLTLSISSLLVLTLIELLRHEETKQGAERHLASLGEGRFIPAVWGGIIRKMVEANTQTDFDDRRLQQLAEAASGTSEANRDIGGGENRNDAEGVAEAESKNRPSRQFKELRALVKAGHWRVFTDVSAR